MPGHRGGVELSLPSRVLAEVRDQGTGVPVLAMRPSWLATEWLHEAPAARTPARGSRGREPEGRQDEHRSEPGARADPPHGALLQRDGALLQRGGRRWTQGRLPGAVPDDWRQEASPSPVGKVGLFGNVLMDWGGKWVLGRRDDPLGVAGLVSGHPSERPCSRAAGRY